MRVNYEVSENEISSEDVFFEKLLKGLCVLEVITGVAALISGIAAVFIVTNLDKMNFLLQMLLR